MIFAIVESDVIVNVIEAVSQQEAEAITNAEAIEIDGNHPWIGWYRDEQGWRSPEESPYPSWHWDYEKGDYEAPVPRPDDAVRVWDEETQSWILVVE